MSKVQLDEFEPLKNWWNDRKENEQAWRVPIETIIERNYDLDIKNPNKIEEKITYSSDELLTLLADSMEKSKALLVTLK
jgi:type I restriction enzyme M protein